jgi:hypothetical protein
MYLIHQTESVVVIATKKSQNFGFWTPPCTQWSLDAQVMTHRTSAKDAVLLRAMGATLTPIPSLLSGANIGLVDILL